MRRRRLPTARSINRLIAESTSPNFVSRTLSSGTPPTSSIATRLSESWNISGTTLRRDLPALAQFDDIDDLFARRPR